MAPIFNLHQTPNTWAEAVRLEGLQNRTIHDIDLTSASTIGTEQYLMLRVLWNTPSFDKFDVAKFGLEKWNEIATEMLKSYESWQSYLNSFTGELGQGTFALPRFYQKQVTQIPPEVEFRFNVAVNTPIAHRTRSRVNNLAAGVQKLSFATPTKRPSTPNIESNPEFDDTPSTDTPPDKRSYGPQELVDLNYPRTKDEQIVNRALIDFLNAFIVHRGFLTCWSLYRKPFTASFKSGSFEARTDGCLEGKKLKTHAIVEVKPMLRATEMDRISMQETAEKVAWIKAEPDLDNPVSSCGQRVLISQDRHEIFLTFAEYNAQYIKYLNNTLDKNEDPGFLVLHRYGPWDTGRIRDMTKLGTILLAIALRAEIESEQSNV